MNERIKQLAGQAGADTGQIIANVICGDDEFVALGDEFNKLSKETRDRICEVIEQNQEKFAELIVKKCIDVSLQSSHRDDDMGAIIARNIKKHFGVKE